MEVSALVISKMVPAAEVVHQRNPNRIRIQNSIQICYGISIGHDMVNMLINYLRSGATEALRGVRDPKIMTIMMEG